MAVDLATEQAERCNLLLIPEPELQRLFRRRVERWKSATAHLSNPERKFAHPTYISLIGLGRQLIPLLLHELQTKPSRSLHFLYL